MKKFFIAILVVFLGVLQADDDLRCKEFNSFTQTKEYIACLQKFVNQDDFIAKKQMARFYYTSQKPYKNYKKAISWYLKVEAHDVNAQYTIAQIYTVGGYGVEKDYKKAAYWYEKAMENGSIPSSVNLAVFYVHGWGVTQDCKKALDLYHGAADKNAWYAQDGLGHLYFDGTCVKKDIEKAKYWIRLGYKNGNGQALWFWDRQNWGPLKKD